jgi:hypothetical protein
MYFTSGGCNIAHGDPINNASIQVESWYVNSLAGGGTLNDCYDIGVSVSR